MSADSASDVSGPVATITGIALASNRGIDVDLFADDRDERMPRDRVGDGLREPLAIDGQRGAGRHAARFGRAHDERAETPHLFLQQADGVIELVAAERIAADELGEAIGLVDGGGTDRPHLVERDRHAAATPPATPPREPASPPPTIVTPMSLVAHSTLPIREVPRIARSRSPRCCRGAAGRASW